MIAKGGNVALERRDFEWWESWLPRDVKGWFIEGSWVAGSSSGYWCGCYCRGWVTGAVGVGVAALVGVGVTDTVGVGVTGTVGVGVTGTVGVGVTGTVGVGVAALVGVGVTGTVGLGVAATVGVGVADRVGLGVATGTEVLVGVCLYPLAAIEPLAAADPPPPGNVFSAEADPVAEALLPN